MKIKFKKIFFSFAVVVSFIAYAVFQRFGSDKSGEVSSAPDISSGSLNVPGSNTASASPALPVVPAAPTVPPTKPVISRAPVSASMKDGTYTGASADAYYGNVQVKAVIKGGRLTDVQLAAYPKENQTSVLINDQALQILKSEAIRAQSAQIDAVSGATYTSYAYITSLSSALTKAGSSTSGVTVKNLPKPAPPVAPPAPPAKPATMPKPTPANGSMFVDGQYTGAAADAYYGTVQVKAIIQGGKITDVQFLNYPQTHQTSILINNQAMPILTSEAIQAQSAQVNAVSGATYTSYAFMQSLTSALNQALAQPQSPSQPAPTLPPAPQLPPINQGNFEND